MSSESKRVLIQVGLFIVTVITTTLAGAELAYSRSILYMPEDYSWDDFLRGFEFSIPFLFILTVHEFGHYFTARYYKIKVSLPYYIPVPPLPILLNIGTFGALIRLREKVYSKKQNFDIGIAGPLAGFVAALFVLYYGFSNLPAPEYIYKFHPEYEQYGLNYAETVYDSLTPNTIDVVFGKNLLFLFFERYVADPARVPNAHEIMHYPIIMAGFFSLIFTFLNLLPIGQLDGGHVAYGLLGYKKHKILATVLFLGAIFYAGMGLVSPSDKPEDLMIMIPASIAYLYVIFSGLRLSQRDKLMYALLMFAAVFVSSAIFPKVEGDPGWLLFCFIVGRFIGVEHPLTEIEEPLDAKRIMLGLLALVIFVVCFSPSPIEADLIIPKEP
jgi:membrane-associated protease RseP (regulator of RpoE activity)